MATRELHARPEPARRGFGDRYVIAADRVFDGTRVLEDHAVAVWGDRVAAVAPADRLSGPGQRIRFAGTLLPGFIDLHGHPLLGQVPPEKILRHGITTIRDTGGPLVAPSGGDGRLRVLAAGPILTAPGGYPIPVFGPGRRPARRRRCRADQDRGGAGRLAGCAVERAPARLPAAVADPLG
jgi:hypothetical protein